MCGWELDPIVYWAPQPRQTGPHTHLLVGHWDGRVRRQRHGRFGHYLGREPSGTRRFYVALNSGSPAMWGMEDAVPGRVGENLGTLGANGQAVALYKHF